MPEQSLCLSWNIRAVQFGIRRRLALGRLAAHGVLPRWPLWLIRLCWGGALVFAWLEQGWGQVLQWYAGQLADPDPLVRRVAADRLLLYGETWTVLAALAVLSSGPWLWRGLLGCLLGFGARRLPAGFGRPAGRRADGQLGYSAAGYAGRRTGNNRGVGVGAVSAACRGGE